jgi:TatD DNase family protein
MPRERVLTESDGPFAQVDSQTVMPWHVESAADELAQVWDLSPEEVSKNIADNLQRLLATD